MSTASCSMWLTIPTFDMLGPLPVSSLPPHHFNLRPATGERGHAVLAHARPPSRRPARRRSRAARPLPSPAVCVNCSERKLIVTEMQPYKKRNRKQLLRDSRNMHDAYA